MSVHNIHVLLTSRTVVAEVSIMYWSPHTLTNRAETDCKGAKQFHKGVHASQHPQCITVKRLFSYHLYSSPQAGIANQGSEKANMRNHQAHSVVNDSSRAETYHIDKNEWRGTETPCLYPPAALLRAELSRMTSPRRLGSRVSGGFCLDQTQAGGKSCTQSVRQTLFWCGWPFWTWTLWGVFWSLFHVCSIAWQHTQTGCNMPALVRNNLEEALHSHRQTRSGTPSDFSPSPVRNGREEKSRKRALGENATFFMAWGTKV